jgi:hypothetical protein
MNNAETIEKTISKYIQGVYAKRSHATGDTYKKGMKVFSEFLHRGVCRRREGSYGLAGDSRHYPGRV